MVPDADSQKTKDYFKNANSNLWSDMNQIGEKVMDVMIYWSSYIEINILDDNI